MKIENMKFRGDRCFATEWAGFEELRPINIIIGRNNVGKSQLLDLVKTSCVGFRASGSDSWEYLCKSVLSEPDLRRHFPDNISSSDLGGNHWGASGRHFVDADVTWVTNRARHIKDISVSDFTGAPPALTDARLVKISQILHEAETPLQGKRFMHLVADRDIQPEKAHATPSVAPNGVGATNLIRRHITSTSSQYPRERVQIELREALNEIFGPDGHFTEVQVQQDEDGDESWEVYLGEARKGLIALSASGSGLKTVILTLIYLLLIPKIDGKPASEYVFAFEELENNLHPALLRRLLKYIERFSQENGSTVFLTTHSSATLDLFGASSSAQIVHVEHDGATAKALTLHAHFDRLGVISALGAKPSDLLQANGVIWVEGPSDAIYMNRWIEMKSAGRFREGRDYLCAFYGGSLLARAQFVGPEEAEDEFINLLQLNHNVVVVCDGDRTGKRTQLKPRVRRVKDELSRVPGAEVWITQPKEIEGYLTGALFARAVGLNGPVRDPDEFEQIFPLKAKDGSSYVESALKVSAIDKIELAAMCAKHSVQSEMQGRFDWDERMAAVVAAVERWNA